MLSDELFKILGDEIAVIANDKDYAFNLPIKDFIKAMSLIRPQAYGKRIENRVCQDFNFNSVPASEDRGDLKKKGKYYELKVSIINHSNPTLNMVQIRQWQDVDYYLCIAFDIRDIDNFQIYPFRLTKKQMERELKLTNFTSAHGTKMAIKHNKNIELRIALKMDANDEMFQRWYSKYYVPYEEL